MYTHCVCGCIAAAMAGVSQPHALLTERYIENDMVMFRTCIL